MATATLEDLFQEFQKLPDWNRYPLPEVFYEHFKVKKLQPASLNEVVCYNPPPYQSLNEDGKVELRGPVEGGVRTIEGLAPLPVEVKKRNDETGELEEYPTVKKISWLDQVAEIAKEKIDASPQLQLKDSPQTIDKNGERKSD